MVTSENILCHSQHTAWRLIDGEAVIMGLDSIHETEESPRVKLLNSTGSRVWELMNGVNTVDCIAHAVSEEFETSYSQALGDIVDFLKRLVELRLAYIADAPHKDPE